MMRLRKASLADIPAIMHIMAQARAAQRALGFRQWDDGYPPESQLEEEISAGRGLVLDDGDAVCAYAAIVADDPEYSHLHNVMTSPGESYAVIHRLAISDAYRGRGIGRRFLALLEEEMLSCDILWSRADTGLENLPMQKALAAAGYRLLCRHNFVWGPRLVYEKPLHNIQSPEHRNN